MQLDPRTKLIMVFSLSTLAVFVQDNRLLLLVLTVSVLLVAYFTADFRFVKKARKFIILFLGIAIIQSIFAPEGEVLFKLGDLTLLTAGGLQKGIRVILRMLIIIVSAVIMTGSSAREIVQGLIRWKVPFEIAFMVSLATRFLPILGEEARDVYTAIQLRGIEPEKLPLKQRIKLYSYLLMPVLTGVIVKARELSTSMEMRAFRAYPRRTSYLRLEFKQQDYIVIALSLSFLIVILLLYLLNIW